jgi:predicted transposase/invertase (TIGR01784 family)
MPEFTEIFARFTPEQVRSYEDSLKYYRDLKNSLDTAREEGKEEGKIEGFLEGKIEVAKNLLKSDVAIDIIIKSTGLTEFDINKLK